MIHINFFSHGKNRACIFKFATLYHHILPGGFVQANTYSTPTTIKEEAVRNSQVLWSHQSQDTPSLLVAAIVERAVSHNDIRACSALIASATIHIDRCAQQSTKLTVLDEYILGIVTSLVILFGCKVDTTSRTVGDETPRNHETIGKGGFLSTNSGTTALSKVNKLTIIYLQLIGSSHRFSRRDARFWRRPTRF